MNECPYCETKRARIRELEAEAAGVEGLLAAAVEHTKAEDDHDGKGFYSPEKWGRTYDAEQALSDAAREYAKSKEKTDGQS